MSNEPEEISVEISEKLENVAVCALNEAVEKLSQGDELAPFIVVVQGDDMYFESFPGENIKECFANARAELAKARNDMDCYALCYDGYVETDDGQVDAVIAECAEKGEPKGHALCLMYEGEGEELVVAEGPAYIDTCPSIFA